jgi:hypothetical protein
MRFMVPKAKKDSEAGAVASKELIAAMGKFNEHMAKASVLLAAETPHPRSKGARVKSTRTKRRVTDGPFTETKELLAGWSTSGKR